MAPTWAVPGLFLQRANMSNVMYHLETMNLMLGNYCGNVLESNQNERDVEVRLTGYSRL